MKPLIVKAGTTMPELHALINEHVKLELNQSLTAVDIYVGDDHLRIACRIDAMDQIMADVVKTVRIPGESVICHEAIGLDEQFVDYTQWPIVCNGRQLQFRLKMAFGLSEVYECRSGREYLKTTDYDARMFFEEKYGLINITKYLTKLD